MELVILKDQTKKIETMTIRRMEVEPPYEIYTYHTCFGIDGGTRNMGVAKIYPNNRDYVTIYEVSLERKPKPIDRMLDVQRILAETIVWFGYDPKAVIEGAAYMNSIYRQAELAEVRAAMALWLHTFGVQVEFAPPNTIRKKVFGKGKEKNPWSNIPGNAAAALGCAYYATKMV